MYSLIVYTQALPRREGHDREEQEEREDKVLVIIVISRSIYTRASNEPSRRLRFYNHEEGPY